MSEAIEDNTAGSDIKPTRTARFAEWLMAREQARAEKDSSLESLVKINVVVSFLTLGLVGGFSAVQTALAMIPYL